METDAFVTLVAAWPQKGFRGADRDPHATGGLPSSGSGLGHHSRPQSR